MPHLHGVNQIAIWVWPEYTSFQVASYMQYAICDFQVPKTLTLKTRPKKIHFHCNSFPLGLNLKQRFGATQKWPISNWEMELVGNFFGSIFLLLPCLWPLLTALLNVLIVQDLETRVHLFFLLTIILFFF